MMDEMRAQSPEVEWFAMIYWRTGEVDNVRGADGSTVWRREPDPGWSVEFGGYKPGAVPSDTGTELFPGVRAIIQPRDPPFPGGTIDLVDHRLMIRLDDAV